MEDVHGQAAHGALHEEQPAPLEPVRVDFATDEPGVVPPGGDTIELYADRTRALPVNDPFDRELTISCGAALLNLCVAAEAAGFSSTPQLLPVSDDDDLLAAHRNSHGCVLRDDGARTAAATSASLVTGVTELMEHLRTSVES